MRFSELTIGDWFWFCQPTDKLGRYEKLSESDYAGTSNTFTVGSQDAEVMSAIFKRIDKR